MSRLQTIACTLGLLATTGGPLTTPALAGEDKPKVKPADGQKPAPADGPKVIVLQLDASKLPPDVLKKLLELGDVAKPADKPGAKPQPADKPTTKPGVKPQPDKPGAAGKVISLADAIAIAEKGSNATAVRASRETGKDGAVEFVVELTDAKGEKSKVVIDGSGKTPGAKPGGEKPGTGTEKPKPGK